MSTPDMSAFAKYIPGFEFLQNLTRQAAGGATPDLQSGVPGMPPMSQWVAPVFDVDELDKRIQDMKAVHFWLEQNTKALGATIQALEVQRMTLATLKGMNVSLAEMADAFKIKPEAPAAQEPPAQPAAQPEPEGGQAAASGPAVDPMQWWNALTQQFQTIAGEAMRDMADQATRTAEQMAQTMQQASAATTTQGDASADKAGTARAARKPASKAARKAPAKRAPAPAKPKATPRSPRATSKP